MARRLGGPVAWLLAVVVLLTACGGQPAVATVTTSTTSAVASTPVASVPVASATTARATPTVAPVPNALAETATSTSAVTSTAAATTQSTVAVSAAPAASATPLPVIPVKLQIPAISVIAPVELVGLTSDGAMDVPKEWNDVGWYEYGPTPGQVGNSAMAGHLDSTTAPAVFWRLGSLKAGDKIMITMSNGDTVTFVVTQKVSYPYNEAPIAQVFGPATAANLNLITCGGSWDAFTKNYSNRIVVYTTKA
ncbi:MAG: class F sortase [Chloroflexota bacterium]